MKNTFGLGPLDAAIADINAQPMGIPLQDGRAEPITGLTMPEPRQRQSAQQADVLDGRNPSPAMDPVKLVPPPALVPLFESNATKYNVPANVLMAIAQQESNYNANARGVETQWGKAGGMMQYLEPTAKALGINQYDPAQAVGAAAKQIRERLDKGYSMDEAVMEHFAGPNRKMWGAKTGKYGQEVIAKARAIADALYPVQPEPVPDATGPQSVAETDQRAINEVLESQPKPAPEASWTDNLVDIGKNLKIGFNIGAQDARELAKYVLPDSFVTAMDSIDKFVTGKSSEELLKGDTESMLKSMSPQMQAAIKKDWWDSDKGEFGDAWKDWRSYASGVVQSAPEMAMTMAPAMMMAKTAYSMKLAAGATQAVAAKSAARAAMAAGMLGEGALGGAQSSREVRDRIMELKPGVLAQSDAYNALIESGLTPEKARKTLADDKASQAFAAGGVVTGMFGGFGDRAIAKIVTERVNKGIMSRIASGVGKGVIGDGVLEELPQSAGQALAQNAVVKTVDESQDITDDVLNQALGGLATGAVQGGIMGGGAGAMSRRGNASDESAAPAAEAPAAPDAPAGGTTTSRGPDGVMRVDMAQEDGSQSTPIDAESPAPAEETMAPQPPAGTPLQSQPTAPAAAGPLARAAQKHEQAADESRVVLETPAGMVPGFLISREDTEGGGYTAQVLTDDGQTMRVTDADPVRILSPQQAQEANEQRRAAEAAANNSQPADNTAETLADTIPNEQATRITEDGEVVPADGAENVSDDGAASATSVGSDGTDQPVTSRPDAVLPADAAPPADAPARDTQSRDAVPPAPADRDTALEPAAKAPASMTLDELTSRMDYLKSQAQLNGGWNKPLVAERRKVESAMRKLKPADLKPADAAQPDQVTPVSEPAAVEAPATAAPAPRVAQVQTPQGKALLEFEDGQGQPVLVRQDQYDDASVTSLAAFNERGFRLTGQSGNIKRSYLTLPPQAEAAPEAVAQPAKLTPEDRAEADAVWTRSSPNDRTGILMQAGFGENGELTRGGRVLLTLPYDEIGSAGKAAIAKAVRGDALPSTPAATPAPAPAAEAAPAPKPKAKKLTAAQRGKAISDYFNPGNIVPSVDGHDRVISFDPASGNVRVQEVEKVDGQWMDVVSAPRRTHRTMPDDRALAAGPTVRAEPAAQAPEKMEKDKAIGRNAAGIMVREDANGVRFITRDGVRISESVFLRPTREGMRSGVDPDARGADFLTVEESAAAKPESAAVPAAGSTNTVFTADAAEKARAVLRAKLGNLNAGIDPEVMQAGFTLAGYHIEAGARSFAAYAKAMVNDMGEGIRPYLKSFYMSVLFNPAAAQFEGMSTATEVEAADINAMEATQNDTQEPVGNSDAGAEGSGAPGVQADAERGNDAAVPDQPARRDVADDQRSEDADRDAGRAAQTAVQRRGETASDDQQPVQSGRGSGAATSDRANRQPASGARNYRIAAGELTREGSWATTARRNVDIVELVKRLEDEGRAATQDERALMSKFTGWGASEIANGVFPNQAGEYKSPAWKALGERLQAAMTPEQYAQARRTTQYAHYTSEGVIRSIYDGLGRLGFKGGSIVEPGMGIGAFNGLMPASMATASTYTGIEYDSFTGAIAKHLYPESNIIVGDFTRTALPRDSFDAAIGNPPFSSTVVANDQEYRKQNFMLHDYFFAKTMDRVKPGGLVVFVTSKGTMDKATVKARKYLADRANLIAAVRLPQTAFKDNAGTEVVTDVLFLQKRGPGVEDNGVAWMGLKDVKTTNGAVTPVNEYFAANPQMVLGDHALTGSMYRANEYTVTPRAGDIEQQFAEALQSLPENVYKPERGSRGERAAVIERDYNPANRKEGGLYIGDDGKLMQTDSGSGIEANTRIGTSGKEIALKPNEKRWLKGYVGVRDALKQAQADQLTDGDWQTSLKRLNAAYDAFTAEHGPILAHTIVERTSPDGSTSESIRYKNKPLFEMDAEGALAYALEHIKEDGSIEKGVALRERVLRRDVEPEIRTTQDALFVSLNRNGDLDIDDVAKLAGTTREEAIAALGNAVYQDPAGNWQQADKYLSGNVRRKLEEARVAAASNPAFKRNVEALEAVQPRLLGPGDITVRPGANWVPTQDYQDFTAEIFGEKMAVKYNAITGDWTVSGNDNRTSEWATSKMAASTIFDAVVNNKQIRVTYMDAQKKTHVDPVETEKANDIAGKMRRAFSSWIFTDPARADRLTNFYNENFNNIAPRTYDGSHLTLPGVSLRFNLYPHQKRAIWRNIQDGDTYLAHSVGAGKTFTMIASGMEEKRLGLIRKPMYAVPNHMLAQFSREFLELYPTANIMVADEANFHTGNRRRFLAQASLNNPDAIIITHSAFGRVGMSDQFYRDYITKQIDDWRTSLEDVEKGDRISVKRIEKRIEQLESRLEERLQASKKDAVLTFEELGVDRLYVDEMHEFRKLDFATNQGNIKGIDSNGSQRAMDLQMKTQYLRSKNPTRALTGASGTPVTNTMGELYTIQRFMDPKQLAEDGMDTFDAWASQYGDTVTALEQNAAGGYEAVTRFAKFQNVPELMRRVRSFMDILTSNNLGDLVKRPDVETGARQIVVTPAPTGYAEYQKSLEARIKAIRARKGPPSPGDDIILSVIADGRFSAIDMRFVDPTAAPDPNSKLNQSIDDLIQEYHNGADLQYTTNGVPDALPGSSLILFADIGLGEQSAKSRGFSMRDWITQRLTDAGIPREHIAFIRDYKQHAKKERLFADMREGKRRILIGGKDMETGVNVQKRLKFLGHLDAPWFPASVEQREGRIVRQGNQNADVRIKAYATKGSYDSTMWGMNARKARFIEQAMNGDDSVRSLEDVSEASAFEMAAALASGDERYLKLAGLNGDVQRLERLRQAHYDQQNKMRQDKGWAESSIRSNQATIEALREGIAQREPIVAGEFKAQIGSETYDDRETFSKGIFDAFKALAADQYTGKKRVGAIGGFPIVYNSTGNGSTYSADISVDVPGEAGPIITFPLDPDLAINGIATRAANQVNGLDRQLQRAEESIAASKKRIETIDKRLGDKFADQAELMEKQAQRDVLEAELAAESEEANADTPDNAALPDDVALSVAPRTDSPAFREWFGDSKVVDAAGKPLVVYRGEHGQGDQPRSLLGSFTFSESPDIASVYAERPNDRRTFANAESPRVYPAYLSIRNPIIENRDDPFVDLSDLVEKIGRPAVEKLARKHSDWITGTGNWEENFSSDFANVDALLDARPEAISDLYMDVFPLLDDFAFVQAAKDAGYDGAIHSGNGESALTVEYRVFSPEQIKSATGNRGTYSASNPDITYSVAVNGERVRANRRGVADLRSQDAAEFTSTPAQRAMDKAALRAQVFDNLPRDVTLAHPDVGAITINSRGVGKSRANSADRAKLLTVPHLADIVRDGAYMGSKPATTKGAVTAYHHIARRVTVDGVPLTAWVTLEENAAGRISYYNHTMMNDVAGAPTATPVSVDGELAAYRRPSFDPDGTPARAQALSQRHADIRTALTNGPLGGVFDRMMGEGGIILHASQSSLPRSIGARDAAIQGYTDQQGRIHLVADNLTPQTAPAVLLHEAFHAGVAPLVGQANWQRLNQQLARYAAAAQVRRAEGRVKAGDFWDGALKRVDSARADNAISEARAAEEFGAYAIENYELAPDGIRKWVDNILGAIKAWALKKFGVQLGALTPAQLRALAVAALRSRDGLPTGTDGTVGGMSINDGPLSVQDRSETATQAEKDEALADAMAAFDNVEAGPVKRDFVGQAIQDMRGWRSIYTRFFGHPYQIASLYKDFTPVFMTYTAQQQMRNQIIEDLHQDFASYQKLPQAAKQRVNAALEIGRLTSDTYTPAELVAGVKNPGYVNSVRMDEHNIPHRVRKPIDAQLSKSGDIIKLSESEAQVYTELRQMFDRALDKFRDQALEEFGMEQFAGQDNAAKAIMDYARANYGAGADMKRFENIAQFVGDIEQAKRTGYVPFSRYGDYVVAVKERLADIQYTPVPSEPNTFIARNVPESLEQMLDDMGAVYDQNEGGWRIGKQMRSDLEGANEQTVYSEKVETGLRDMFGRNSERNVSMRQGSVAEIPAVRAAIDRIVAEKVGGDKNRRVVSFATTKKRPEQGVDLSSLDALAEVAQMDPKTWDAVRDQLDKALKAGGFRKHFFQSANVAGYSPDFERSMSDYIVGLSGYLSRRKFQSRWDKTMSEVRGANLHKYASKYREYVNQPAEEMAMLRQTGFFMYLAGNISSAILNLTQVPIMTMPFFSQITSNAGATAEMARAYKDAMAMFRTNRKTGYDLFDFDAAPADIKAELIQARDEGLLLPLQSLEVMGAANRRSVEGRRLQKGYDVAVQTAALPFTGTERLNRVVTFMAATRLAKKPGVQADIRRVFRKNPLAQATFGGDKFSPYTFAEFAVDETQFRMGKGNRPAAMRGAGAAILQFKSFMLQFLEATYRNASMHGKEGKMASAASLMMMVGLAGMWGAPGAEDLKELLEGMYKGATKRDLDIRTEVRKWIYDKSGSQMFAAALDSGLPYVGAGTDFSRRVGMGNLMPDSRNPTGIGWLDSMLAFGGVPADLLVGRPIRAAQQLSRGDAGGATTALLPNFIENARKAVNWSTDGVRTGAGRMVMPENEVKTSSVAMKAIGIQPAQVSDVYAYQEAQRRAAASGDELKRQMTTNYVRALASLNRNTDPEKTAKLQGEVQKIITEIADINARATSPADMIVITRGSIKNQMVREMGGVQSGFGRERKASRGDAANLRNVFGVAP